MKLTELIKDAQAALEEFGDLEVFAVDEYLHHKTIWSMVMPSDYGAVQKGFYIRHINYRKNET